MWVCASQFFHTDWILRRFFLALKARIRCERGVYRNHHSYITGFLTTAAVSNGPIPATAMPRATEHGWLFKADVGYRKSMLLKKPWACVIRSPSQGTGIRQPWLCDAERQNLLSVASRRRASDAWHYSRGTDTQPMCSTAAGTEPGNVHVPAQHNVRKYPSQIILK